jgi:hypothetical protein
VLFGAIGNDRLLRELAAGGVLPQWFGSHSSRAHPGFN